MMVITLRLEDNVLYIEVKYRSMQPFDLVIAEIF